MLTSGSAVWSLRLPLVDETPVSHSDPQPRPTDHACDQQGPKEKPPDRSRGWSQACTVHKSDGKEPAVVGTVESTPGRRACVRACVRGAVRCGHLPPEIGVVLQVTPAAVHPPVDACLSARLSDEELAAGCCSAAGSTGSNGRV
ncbi:uncharacterized protein V6R79_010440 [Siganus canaliculatus]